MFQHFHLRTRARRALIVFPSLALAVSVGCASSSQADNNLGAKRTSTTIKRKVVVTTLPVKGNTNIDAAVTVLSLLAKIKVEKEQPAGYSRSLFKHWTDADGDGCDTREEVLISESSSPAQVDAYGCKVIEGNWLSPYDNMAHTNPSDLDIDHMVPLKEAWDSGANSWSASQRQLFANDLSDSRTLIAVTARQNRSKSDRDPSNWIPPNAQYTCTYLTQWVAIKFRWKLSMDQSEFGRIKKLLPQTCATGASPVETIATAPAAVDTVPSLNATSPVASEAPQSPTSGARQVSPLRCKKAEFGQTGEYKSIPYICSDRRADGSLYAVGYYFWRPA